jgi:hypothetical protein
LISLSFDRQQRFFNIIFLCTFILFFAWFASGFTSTEIRFTSYKPNEIRSITAEFTKGGFNFIFWYDVSGMSGWIPPPSNINFRLSCNNPIWKLWYSYVDTSNIIFHNKKLFLPIWPLIVVCACVIGRDVITRQRKKPCNLCRCGYCLLGLVAGSPCPECGRKI